MTTYVETFNKADSSTLGPVLTWEEFNFAAGAYSSANCAVKTNSFALDTFSPSTGGTGLARATARVGSTAMSSSATIVALSASTTNSVIFYLGCCCGSDTTSGASSFFFSGVWAAFSRTSCGLTVKDGPTSYNQSVGSPTTYTALAVNDVLKVDYNPFTHVVNAYVNGVVVNTADISAYLADTNFPDLGDRGAVGALIGGASGNATANVDRLDTFTISASGAVDLGTVLPIPFWVGNDRYETIALAYEGSTTGNAPPEFRHFYAGPQLWEETLAGDTSLPPWHALDENGTYPYGELELPFREFNDGREVTIDGIRVEFTPIPYNIDNTIDSATSVGFTARVEGYGIPDTANVTPIGVFSSDAMSYATTYVSGGPSTYTLPSYDVIPAEWPNTQSVWLPLRLPQKIRAARVILTDVHLLEINSITLLGQFVPSRTV